jgi:signal transduction histidine kinase
VPVIVLSAKTSREAVVKGLALGASDYLGKPFHRDELTCRIKNHLQLKRSRDQLKEEVRAKTSALQLAEDASKVKSQFLANMSHELRTPLGGILGFADLSLEACCDCNPEMKDYLGTIRQCADSLLRLTNDILDMAKIEFKHASLDYSPFRPAQLIEKVAAGLSEEARRNGLYLEVSCAEDLKNEFFTDAPKLEHALLNLVENAIKFTPKGGVRVSARLVPGAEEDGAMPLEIKVADSGIGIAPDKLEQIFQPFNQADNSTTRRYGGTGLGLTLSRSLSRMLGGDVTVESQLDAGSTFTLCVRVYGKAPARETADSRATAEEAARPEPLVEQVAARF